MFTNRRAGPFLIDEMRRFQQVSTFDEQPMPELNSEVIDFRVASEYFRPTRKLTRPALQTLRTTTAYQNRIVPTVGGVLLFGVNRRDHFPDAWIQTGHFEGSDRRRIIDLLRYGLIFPGRLKK